MKLCRGMSVAARSIILHCPACIDRLRLKIMFVLHIDTPILQQQYQFQPGSPVLSYMDSLSCNTTPVRLLNSIRQNDKHVGALVQGLFDSSLPTLVQTSTLDNNLIPVEGLSHSWSTLGALRELLLNGGSSLPRWRPICPPGPHSFKLLGLEERQSRSTSPMVYLVRLHLPVSTDSISKHNRDMLIP